ncbi:DUF1569 domain-containing protein [Mucilaginibacter arboris]|uniref:DUF1569 domain-containing protein n=1 Tax=Mucilaginibacter arboris TaxID=2682090 RepID=A0A7K1ST79_9SPHI|nr:DUF1569 domain-containing protein [Mucilaginibacter arboris]MVN20518.1 DUF1569 domain-containing protein [Mucilaginibacter arboris]
MKTIFDKTTRGELINRINTLNENSTAQWGKMNVYQMLKHCTRWEEMMLGNKKYKRAFIGRLFGKMALKNVLKDEKPLRRNTPTIPELKISGNGNVLAQKAEWVARIDEYEHFSNLDFVHPFFGKMTKEQIGHMVYKHIDHHLRQFNS